MGRALGSRLLRAGYPLEVHDRTAAKAGPLIEAGAGWCGSLSELGRDVHAIVSALPGPAEVEAALAGEGGAWSAASRGTLQIETSTIGVAGVRRVSARAAEAGIRYLDCPISRAASGPEGAALSLWAGADADDFDRARPLLETLADHVRYCGGIGQGQVTKLVNNVVAHALVLILGEALAAGVKAGASIDLLRAALHDGTAQNRLLDELLPASAFRGDWRPGLRLDLAIKDLRLAAELAVEGGVHLTGFDALLRSYEEAAARGWGGLSSYAVVRLAEEAAGVTLRSRVFEALAPRRAEEPKA